MAWLRMLEAFLVGNDFSHHQIQRVPNNIPNTFLFDKSKDSFGYGLIHP
jgi:hypothetical protein